MKDEKSIPCPYVVMVHTDDNGSWEEHCGKIAAETSCYCPKHVLFAADDELKGERRKEARKIRREVRKASFEALKISPLQAINPKFDESKKLTGYEK